MSPRRSGRTRGGLAVRRGLSLRAPEITTVDGIPCTSATRTLFDLAGVVDRRTLERACERAEAARLFDLAAVEAIVARAPCRRGRPALREVLEHFGPVSLTRSELEERFLVICLDADLPRPQVNAWMRLDGDFIQADFLWRDQRLVVETDGRATHDTAAAFERDRRRDQRLMLAGWRVVRFTWRQVVDTPEVVAGTVRSLLAARSGVTGSRRP